GSGPHFLRAGRPYAPRRAGSPRRRRGRGERVGGAAWHVAAGLHEALARARGRRPDLPGEGRARGELRALRRADEGRLGLDVALRKILERQARFARPLPVPARGVSDMEQAKLKDKPSLTLERHYPVAPEKVWRAWTDPQALAKWWGPGGNDPVSVAEVDLRVGGRFRMVFGGPQGRSEER